MARQLIPVFSEDKRYDTWIKEIKAWVLTTTIEKKKQGLSIALAFPEKSVVRRRIFDESDNLDDLDADDGVDKLILRLDKWYKQDNVAAQHCSWREMIGYERKKGETMASYISEFTRRHIALKKYKSTISGGNVAFILLDNAGLEYNEKQLVLTGVSYEDESKMLDQMEKSLMKYCGNQDIFSGNSQACSTNVNASSITVKSEPVFKIEEVNATQSRGRYENRGNFGNRGRSRGPDRRNFNHGRGSFKNWNGYKCYICGSEYHLVAKCPKNTYINESEDKDKDSYKPYEESWCSMVYNDEETFNVHNNSKLFWDSIMYAILDTACTTTVCGREWLIMFIESLTDEEKAKILEKKSDSTFRFGDGKVYESLKQVRIPVKIAGREEFITTDVVECFIPLLLSKKSMKVGKMKIDLENDTAMVKGTKVKLDCTTSGHYRLPLQDPNQMKKKMKEIEEVLITLGQDGKEKRKNVKKIHHQFGHPSSKRLKMLFKDAELVDKESNSLVEEITDGCNTCIKFKRTPSRPTVSMNMAKEMNDIVAIDLKEYKKVNIYFLHMIDLATRFSRSCITRSKEPKEIVEGIITTWLGSGLGAPRKFLCDNGGEFANNCFLDLCENMNIQVMHTAAYSPFSNGVCERNHAVIDDMVYKMKAEQPDLKLENALAWAVNAKNCLHMVGGFSPHQLVYGRNPRLPGVMNDDLPALEGTSTSEVIARHLNACHAARKAFIAAEASEKIRRALKGSVKQTRKEFTNGEKVYFKRPERKEWNGPATVIGQEGKTIIVKYGANIVKCHEIHVQEIPYSFERDTEKGRKELLEMIKDNRQKKVKDSKKNEEVCDNDIDYEDEITVPVNRNERNTVQSAIALDTIPKIGQRVKFCQKDKNDWEFGGPIWEVGTIVSRGGKATGQYKDWRNVEDDEGNTNAIDWKLHVDRWELSKILGLPKTYWISHVTT